MSIQQKSDSDDNTKDEASLIKRRAFLWNTASGLLMAFQSVIMLVVLTRVCDVVTAGIFTFAYANANLFLNIGKYGMRNFQVSDIDQQFNFPEYGISRVVSCIVMLVVSFCCLFISASWLDYSMEKVFVVLLMLGLKLIDAAEDVFHADYQRQGRLDVGARVLTFRLSATAIVFALSLMFLEILSQALLIAVLFTTAFFVLETVYVKKYYAMPNFTGSFPRKKVFSLLFTCAPLFAAAFLLFYISNSPKYAIDAVMGDTAQAYYGYIAMPVFVVTLLASFIYNPMVSSLAQQWSRGEITAFISRFVILGFSVVGITLLCVFLAWLAGVPVLNFLYNTDLSAYLFDLIVLVAGGGFLALSALFTMGITIIRFQKSLIWGYALVAIYALVVSAFAVENWGISGAAWTYFSSMVILALWFGISFTVGVKKNRRKEDASKTGHYTIS